MTKKEAMSLLPESVTIKGRKDRIVFINGIHLTSEYSQQIWNHSPDGFNWGYGGSGPAQLALGILLKYLPRDWAVKWHQPFKWAFVATLPMDEFEVTINLKKIIEDVSKN